MNKEKILNVLKENESLKIRVDRLQKSSERLEKRYNDAESDLNNYKRKHDFLKDQFKELARNCFPREFIDLKLGDKSEMELYEFIVKKVTQLEKDNFYSDKEKASIQEQLESTLSELERLQNAGPLVGTGGSVGTKVIGEDGEEVEGEFQVPQGTGLTAQPIPVEAEDNPLAGVMSLIDEKEWPIIKIIGEGETQFAKVVDAVGLANSTVSTMLNELVEKGVINFEKIQKGGKGRPAHHYFLTSLGTKAFELKYKEAPETTLLEKMSTHGSPHHGGLMVEVGTFLQESGCDVEYDGPDTTYRLKSGRDIIFDIKAFDKESKELMLVETERARCGDQHLLEKFDKCYEFAQMGISKTIYIVAPEKESLHRIQQQLFKWVKNNRGTLVMLSQNNQDKAVVIFKTASLEDFKKGKLQIFYYGLK